MGLTALPPQAAMAADHTKAIGVSNFNAELLASLLAVPRRRPR